MGSKVVLSCDGWGICSVVSHTDVHLLVYKPSPEAFNPRFVLVYNLAAIGPNCF